MIEIVECKGTKGDVYHKEVLQEILTEGCLDVNPRPHYEDEVLIKEGIVTDLDGREINMAENQKLEERDGKWFLITPAHTLSINHKMLTYDLSKGEFPITTLRAIPTKSSIGELLWIYQDQSNDLNVLKDKYNVKWWDAWDIGNRTIGSVYGESVREYDQMNGLLKGLIENPDGRRHMITLWLPEQFRKPHGLKPCAFLTMWNVRHGRDGIDYLDMMLVQRSSDFCTAGAINQVQYVVLQCLVARHCGYTPGKFSWCVDNIQIYDRHIGQAKEMIARKPVDCNPKVWINPEKNNFWDMTIDDIKIIDYPINEINKMNPKLDFPIGI